MQFTGFPEPVECHPGFDRIGSGARIAEDVSVFRFGESSVAVSVGRDGVIHRGVRIVIGDTRQHAMTGLHIGDRVHINVGAYLSGEGGLRIGDDVLIGPHAKLLSAGHQIDDGTPCVSHAPLTFGEITINTGAWVGAGATVLEGVCIGAGAVVAAGAVVRESVPDFAVVAGVPAKLVRYRRGFEPARPDPKPTARRSWWLSLLGRDAQA